MVFPRTHHRRDLWIVALLLVVAFIIPTLGVLWFMSEAMRNERLAVRQKIEDLYRGRMEDVRQWIESYRDTKRQSLEAVDPDSESCVQFEHIIKSGVCDSILVYDKTGRLLYPTFAVSTMREDLLSEEWKEAHTLEYDRDNPLDAVEVYKQIAASTDDVNEAALALKAQARCLAKAKKKNEALQALSRILSDSQYYNALDTHGRLIVPDVRLFALDLLDESTDLQQYTTMLNKLWERVNRYNDPLMTSTQRLFLMETLRERDKDAATFPSYNAEKLAVEYVDAIERRESLKKIATTLEVNLPERRLVALFTKKRILSDITPFIEKEVSLREGGITLVPPDEKETAADSFLTLSVGDFLPGWQIALYFHGENPFSAAAEQRIALYLWSAIVVVFLSGVIAIIAARYMGRQIRLTRLKNDFIATVSHELKTPLSSMRVLVDTLLEGRCRDSTQEREYLELVAKENARLSRLIDNFLTFSRMERNKKAFEFEEVRIEDIVQSVREAAGERFNSDRCTLDIDIAPDLPSVTADRDALVTVVMNLLDNAYKYTGATKHIVIRSFAQDECVCIEVEDNGIGMTGRAIKKMFDRFYQVDQHLSRETGGAGLGLSIVKFIVDAHGGTVDVKSEPGKGSTFTVKIPLTNKR